MRLRLGWYTEKFYTNFWALPSLLALFFALLAGLTLYIDHSGLFLGLKHYLNNLIGADSARTTLSVVATTVITITSVTFSITVLTLSLASSQLGPRILPNFMRQFTTQVVLGLFIGTFIYALIILNALPLFDPTLHFPYFSTAIGLVLGVFSFFVLIYFINFICHIIQVDNVLDFLAKDTAKNIQAELPILSEASRKTTSPVAIKKHHTYQTIYRTKKPGYIQTIDYDALLALAEQLDLHIAIDYRPGQFVFQRHPLMTLHHDKQLTGDIDWKDECQNAIVIDNRRSTLQDLEFSFEQLSEIAVRALSPGINNPYTAIHCVDRIIECLVTLSRRKMPDEHLFDKNDDLRLTRKTSSYKDIVDTAFSRFRQQAKFDLSVAIHVLQMVNQMLQMPAPQELSSALLHQCQLLHIDTVKEKLNPTDLNDIENIYAKLKQKQRR